MRSDAAEPGGTDARGPLLATVGYLLVVAVTPPRFVAGLAVEAGLLAVVVAATRVRVIELLGRWVRFLPALVFLAALIAPSHPDRARVGGWALATIIILKNSLAFLAMMTLAQVAPFPRILTAMRRLGLPPVLVSTLRFMDRQTHLLADDLGRMLQARRARSFRRPGWHDAAMLGGLVGMLFLRSLERGERVHAAMLARGWDGEMPSLDDGADPR